MTNQSSICNCSAPTNRNQFSIFDRNQGPMKAIQAPMPTPTPSASMQQPPPRMPQPPQPPPSWNGQQSMPVPPLPGGSFVSYR